MLRHFLLQLFKLIFGSSEIFENIQALVFAADSFYLLLEEIIVSLDEVLVIERVNLSAFEALKVVPGDNLDINSAG